MPLIAYKEMNCRPGRRKGRAGFVRLGVVLMGTGVYGAAGAGVLAELWRRQMEPYAVCGLGTGAWPAALYAAGCSAQGLGDAAAQAQHMGRRMLRRERGFMRERAPALYTPGGMQALMQAQTGGRILALCPRRAIFPLRAAKPGHTVVFSTRSYTPGQGTLLTMQASVSFAARAAMGLPPYLEPVKWMGSPLLPACSANLAARQLFALGAQRVLVVEPCPSPRRELGALELTALCAANAQTGEALEGGAAHLCIPMPEQIGALSFGEITACMEQGKQTAERELDRIFECMGMAFCRVLPFRK